MARKNQRPSVRLIMGPLGAVPIPGVSRETVRGAVGRGVRKATSVGRRALSAGRAIGQETARLRKTAKFREEKEALRAGPAARPAFSIGAASISQLRERLKTANPKGREARAIRSQIDKLRARQR